MKKKMFMNVPHSRYEFTKSQMEKSLHRLDDRFQYNTPDRISSPKKIPNSEELRVSESHRDEDPPYYEKRIIENYKPQLQCGAASKSNYL